MRRSCSMNYKIKALPDFVRTLKRLGKKYHSIKQDYAKLLEELYANPQAGIDLGGGLRKVRMAIGSKGRGKSHGARVISNNSFFVPFLETFKTGRFCLMIVIC